MLHVALGLLLAAGCATPADKPPEIHYGQDECAECHMQVSEERFAGGRVIAGQVQAFDDIAELFEFRRKSPDPQERLWVHDYETGAWLSAPQATYLRSDFKTPMGYGLVAFGQRERAVMAAQTHPGKIFTFEEVCQADFSGHPTEKTEPVK